MLSYLTLSEEPADSVGDFCELHNLPHDVYHGILVDVRKQSIVVCTRAEPAKFKTPIFFEGRKVGLVRIVEGDEPVDAIYRFSKKHKKRSAKHMSHQILVCLQNTFTYCGSML